MRDNIKALFVTILVIVLVFCGLAVIFTIENTAKENKFNDGLHYADGGHWVYQQAVGHQYSTGYLYICDKCGDTLELNKYHVPIDK